jgi:hypothetical protein
MKISEILARVEGASSIDEAKQYDVWVDEDGAKIRMKYKDFGNFVVNGLGLRPKSSQPDAKRRGIALRSGRIHRGEEPVPRGWLDHIRKTYKNVKITNDPNATRKVRSDKGSKRPMDERRLQAMYDKAMKKLWREAKAYGRDWAADAWNDELIKNPNRSADEVERDLLNFAQSAASDTAMYAGQHEFPELWRLLPARNTSVYDYRPTRSNFRDGAADAYGDGFMSGVSYQKKKFAKKFKGRAA